MRKFTFTRFFYFSCALLLIGSIFVDKLLSFGLILGALLSYGGVFIFNKQKAVFEKTKNFPVFLFLFLVKYALLALILYLTMLYSRMLLMGAVTGFLLNQIALLLERARSRREDKDPVQ